MNELLSDGLWPRLRRLAKKANKKHAAIAYVTDDRFIKFGEGDVLVTDASDGAIKAGQTSSQVLKRAVRRGASVFSVSGLHAKLYVFDRVAVIGSANLSLASERLTEAAVVTDQPSTVGMARSLMEDLKRAGDPVDQTFLQHICKLPVTKTIGRGRARRRRRFRDATSKTWLVGLTPAKELEKERFAVEDGCRTAQRHLSNEESEVSWIRYRGDSRFRKEAKQGDSVICIWTPGRSKTPTSVFRHAPILVRQDDQANNCTRFYVEEFPDAEETALTWGQFRRLYAQVGVPGKLGQWSHREIVPNYADALHNLWVAE